MFREAKEYGLREPELIDMGSDFRINLYRKAAATDQNGVIDPKAYGTKVSNNGAKLDTNDTKADTNAEMIMRILRNNPKVTQREVVEKLGISIATVKRIMNSLQRKGIIKRNGSSRNWTWIVLDSLKFDDEMTHE